MPKKIIHEWSNGSFVERIVDMTNEEIEEQEKESTVIVLGGTDDAA